MRPNRLLSWLFKPPGLALVASLCLLCYVAWTGIQSMYSAELAGIPHDSVSSDNVVADQAPQDNGVKINQIPSWHLFGINKRPAPTAKPKVINAPETRLNLKLHGIIFASDEDEGHAIISSSGKNEERYSIGDSIPGGALLERVEKERVLIRRNNRLESLSLNVDMLALTGKDKSKGEKIKVTGDTEKPATYRSAPAESLLEYRKSLVSRRNQTML